MMQPLDRRQAVVLIHGIGEQKPMDTLRGFVNAVWTRDRAIHNRFAGHAVWSKPDTVSEGYELRCLTTPQNESGIRTDFYEFYWAHLMEGTSYGHVLAWARALLIRKPGTVPKHLRLTWWLIVVLLSVALFFGVRAAFTMGDEGLKLPGWVSLGISLLLLPVAGVVIRSIVGDAARYLRAAPTNVRSRHQIRLAGITLLKTLHTRGYDRIIIVGHSLGSVIGYDILTHAWVEFHQQGGTPGLPGELDALEAEAHVPSRSVVEVQAMQRRYLGQLQDSGSEWRVTDFITLGSPLAHAPILLAHDAGDLTQKQKDRELPTCLPTLETLERGGKHVHRFSFGKDEQHRVPHHAAVFGPTRWTNLYFPSQWILRGDLIGGPLGAIFGPAVLDRAVHTQQWAGLLSHTLYWRFPKESEAAPPHITTLRDALDLVDSRGV